MTYEEVLEGMKSEYPTGKELDAFFNYKRETLRREKKMITAKDDAISRAEAIKYLIKPTITSTSIGEEKQKELNAYNMAIKALEQEPCTDAISRQAVDEIKELMTDINGDTVYAVRMSDIRQLPPVKPQERIIGHCKDCKYFE